MLEFKSGASRSAPAILLAGLLSASGASALDIAVKCNGVQVGKITVASQGAGNGIAGDFVSSTGTPPSLAAAATACDEDHFNWYQVVTADNGKAVGADGKFLTPPYVDPPPGGYNYLWGDKLPWYWNETTAPAGTANVDPNFQLAAQTTKDTLHFADAPSSAGNISFMTWLVSLNKDGSFHAFEGGFSWNYAAATDTDSDPVVLAGDPTDAQYKNIIGGFATSVPEPGVASMMAAGMAMMLLTARRRREAA